MQRQRNTKRGSAYTADNATTSPNSAFVALDNRPRNSQPQSRSMIFLSGEERVKNPLPDGLRNAMSIVNNHQVDFALALTNSDGQPAIGWQCVYRIRQKVREDLEQLSSMAHDHRVGRYVLQKIRPFRGELWLVQTQRRLCQGRQIDRFLGVWRPIETQRAMRNTGDIRELFGNLAGKLPHLGRIVGVHLQQIRQIGDRLQGIIDFMHDRSRILSGSRYGLAPEQSPFNFSPPFSILDTV